MARIGQRRPPAEPATDGQQARRDAILRAAARLGRTKELGRIQAQDIAAAAGVALRTLYRYYPTKNHIYAAVLTARMHGVSAPSARPDEPAAAVADFMAEACREMLSNKHLAHAMITSIQVVRAHEGAVGDTTVQDAILHVAGIVEPTSEQRRIARLVEQVAFGVLTWTVGGELEADVAVADIRLACHRLVATAFNH